MRQWPRDRVSSLSRYLGEIGTLPTLTKKKEQETALRARPDGGEGDTKRLVESNLGFVVRIALRYRQLGLPLEDLLSEGNVGLLEAARHYDPARGVKFISFAVWWIRKYMLSALRRHRSLVSIPSCQIKRIRRVQDAQRRLEGALGREAGRDELARELRLTIAKIDGILQNRGQGVSIDERSGRGSDRPLVDLLQDRREPDPEQRVIRNESRTRVRLALRALDEREWIVLAHRFGLGGQESLTLSQIGRRLNLSREAIRLIEVKALRRLRRSLMRLDRPVPRTFRGAHEPVTRPQPNESSVKRRNTNAPTSMGRDACASE